MKKINVLSIGTSSKGANWARVQKIEGNFILTGFLTTVEPLEVGEVEIPSSVEKAIVYQA